MIYLIDKSIKVAILYICCLLLLACSDKSNKELEQMNYKIGFPEKTSLALKDFIRHYSTLNNGIYLLEQNNEHIYAKKNHDSDSTSIEYFSISEEHLEKNIDLILQDDHLKQDFTDIVKEDSVDTLMQKVDTDIYDLLPQVTLNDSNNLHITTKFGNNEYSLPDELKEFGLKPTDELIINGYAVNNDEFAIAIRNLERDDENGFILFFIKQDFSDTSVTSSFEKPYQQSIKNAELKEFEEVIYKDSSNDKATKVLNNHYGVFDINNNSIATVAESDLQSENDLFVYLGGNKDPLAEGMQHIQKIEDYLDGNDANVSEFNLNFKQISDELNLNSVDDVSLGKVIYFDQDYVVLFLDFKAAVTGTAGSTNIIVDFKEDKENPIIYLVDLGLH